MSITTTSFSPNTLIKSADVNTNFSNITTAIPWSANPIAAKGDIPVGSAASTTTTLSVGTDGQVLAADSTQPTGVKWTNSTAPTYVSVNSNLGLSATVLSNALTIKLTQADGASDPTSGSPVTLGFRNSTLTTGGYNARSVTSSVTLTVPSGATLGTANSKDAYLWVYAIDNAGTVELGVAGVRFDEGPVYSTTAISSSSSSNNVIYSTSARSSKPIHVLGRILINETSAGTWASAPTEVSLRPAINDAEAVYMRAWGNTGQSITASTTDVPFSVTTDFDTHNAWNGSLFTAPITGMYLLSAALSVTPSASIAWFAYKNGTIAARINSVGSSVGNFAPMVTVLRLTAGDTLSIRGNTNTTLDNTSSNTQDHHIAITKISS